LARRVTIGRVDRDVVARRLAIVDARGATPNWRKSARDHTLGLAACRAHGRELF
jgi:hypothetical protein